MEKVAIKYIINSFSSKSVGLHPCCIKKYKKVVKHFLLDNIISELFPTLELKFFQFLI